MREISAGEHFDWCVKRAEKYLDRGDAKEGFVSFVSDMDKHEGTKNMIIPELAVSCMLFDIPKGPEAVRKWIKGWTRPS